MISLRSFSQPGLDQDLGVIKYYKLKRNGYYVDIGANDGIDLSNTCMLEYDYEWKGICIEPLPEEFSRLSKNRPNSICIQKAVFGKSGLKLEFAVAGLYSGICDTINHHKEKADKAPKITVETITLNDVLEQANAPSFIEYLSIDTEGSEYDILITINYDKYTFGIIHLEHNFIEPQRTAIREFLESKNYVFVRDNMWDDEYVHKSCQQ
jgi:FkbM family methyltransferase